MKLLITAGPTVPSTITLFDNNNIIVEDEYMEVFVIELAEVVRDYLRKYNIEKIQVKGNKAYCEKIADDLTTVCEETHTFMNDGNETVVERI